MESLEIKSKATDEEAIAKRKKLIFQSKEGNQTGSSKGGKRSYKESGNFVNVKTKVPKRQPSKNGEEHEKVFDVRVEYVSKSSSRSVRSLLTHDMKSLSNRSSAIICTAVSPLN